MRGLLGEKIGEGATADIHVWAPGQIVKLFEVGASPRFGRHEAQMTRAAFAAGAPEVVDEVTLEGRFGIMLQHLDGPTPATKSTRFTSRLISASPRKRSRH